MRVLFRPLLCAVISVIMVAGTACAGTAPQDGFRSSEVLNSRYFEIMIEDGADQNGLAARIAVPPSLRAIIRAPALSNLGGALTRQIDLVYLATLEIMGVRLGNFKSKIKICRDADSLSHVALNLFGRRIKTGGFYVVALDTLYVDAGAISIHILGHELSHAIQCKYFVVPPPEKIQEVLAGFVEYEIRKYDGSLKTLGSPRVGLHIAGSSDR